MLVTKLWRKIKPEKDVRFTEIIETLDNPISTRLIGLYGKMSNLNEKSKF
jgi:hypothetical protein